MLCFIYFAGFICPVYSGHSDILIRVIRESEKGDFRFYTQAKGEKAGSNAVAHIHQHLSLLKETIEELEGRIEGKYLSEVSGQKDLTAMIMTAKEKVNPGTCCFLK